MYTFIYLMDVYMCVYVDCSFGPLAHMVQEWAPEVHSLLLM